MSDSSSQLFSKSSANYILYNKSNTHHDKTHTGVLHGNFDILFNWLRALGVCFKIMWVASSHAK